MECPPDFRGPQQRVAKSALSIGFKWLIILRCEKSGIGSLNRRLKPQALGTAEREYELPLACHKN